VAENTWSLHDSAPVTLAPTFAAAEAEGSWALNDSAPLPLAMTFAAPAAPWTVIWWGGPLSVVMPVQVGGAALIAQERTISRFVFGRLFSRVN